MVRMRVSVRVLRVGVRVRVRVRVRIRVRIVARFLRVRVWQPQLDCFVFLQGLTP